MRVVMRAYLPFSAWKRASALCWALKALMMRSPPSVSSMLLRITPHCVCPSSDTRLRRLPTLPIIYPATGSSTSTNTVSCQLTRIIIVRQVIIIMGFLNIMSSDAMMLFSTSVTSPLMRAITSPLRSLVKKPMGNCMILW